MPARASVRESLLAKLPKKKIGAELGVFRGDFSIEVLRIADPMRFHMIDPWVSIEVGPRRAGWYGADQRTQADMDKIHDDVLQRFAKEVKAGTAIIHRATSEQALSEMPDGTLDWIYVDGDHSYEGALLDLRLSLTKVKPGGMICGDDYATNGWWNGGVERALHEFLHETGQRVIVRFLVDSQFVLDIRS
ncbi:MAG: class I SAM-dependent methyltransferase [Bradyrhizobium sp.]